ncbi:MAG TPA: hypothetical protein VJ654_12775 [Noviherbaspirillum sp.]|nr:hypothetical protein [Noviherbaspirillum sp.]
MQTNFENSTGVSKFTDSRTNELSALEILRSYPSDTKVADLYDQDKEFATALNDLFPGSFEYPDFSWRKIGDIVKAVEKAGIAQSVESVPAHVLNDRYADTVNGDNVAAYDALELHGVRDLNDPGHPDGTQCEVDDQNPQFYSVYAHLRDGGVDCVGDFSDPVRAVGYAAELQRKYHYGLHAFSEPIKQLCHEFALSTADAARIASEKAAFNHVDPSVSQTYAGKVMGISDHHLVLSLGRNAAIFEKAIINGVENLMPGNEVAIAVNDGKAQVVPEKEKEAAISR